MSRRQCCVWGCHNRKGRCAEDIDENRLCECPTLQHKNCPKQDILSLHTIACMPQRVKQAVVQKINLTRQGPRGTKWQPTKGSVICNVHYPDFKGPTKDNKDVFPINFKRPGHYPSSAPAPKRRKVTHSHKPVAPLPSCDIDVAALHTETGVECEEQQQSNVEEGSVLPCDLSRDDLVDIRPAHEELSPDDQGHGPFIPQGDSSNGEQDTDGGSVQML